MKFLVIDDSPLARMTLIQSLQSLDKSCSIIEAENGQEGVKNFEEHKPDIVFMDLTMPVMDGYEASKKIMDIDPLAKIVVITADIQQKAKERVLALGVKEVIGKPLNLDKLTEFFSKF